MKSLQIPALTEEQYEAVAKLYRTTHNVRLHTRAQMVLLAVEQHLTISEIATIVRECEGTVRCWLKRYIAEGIEGLHDAWAGGAPAKVTKAYKDQLLQTVRRRPRSLGQPYSILTLLLLCLSLLLCSVILYCNTVILMIVFYHCDGKVYRVCLKTCSSRLPTVVKLLHSLSTFAIVSQINMPGRSFPSSPLLPQEVVEKVPSSNT